MFCFIAHILTGLIFCILYFPNCFYIPRNKTMPLQNQLMQNLFKNIFVKICYLPDFVKMTFPSGNIYNCSIVWCFRKASHSLYLFICSFLSPLILCLPLSDHLSLPLLPPSLPPFLSLYYSLYSSHHLVISNKCNASL